jgi:hypothetical protein
MAPVRFELSRRFDVPVRELWDELVDWPAHGAWIPATTIEGESGDPTAVGYTFTAWTGFRPVALEDRMRVTRCDWDEAAQTGVCDVEKLGPVLGGGAGFTVRADGAGSGAPIQNIQDRGFEVGGPIKSGKAWYWGSFGAQNIKVGVVGFYNENVINLDGKVNVEALMLSTSATALRQGILLYSASSVTDAPAASDIGSELRYTSALSPCTRGAYLTLTRFFSSSDLAG